MSQLPPPVIVADDLYRKIAWRLLPLLMLSYLVAYLDRVNIGYAQLQMKEMLHFSDAVYGLGAGIFFVGYFLCEVPSNLLLERIGARKTLLRIMLCWGIVASGMMLVQTPWQFYAMRFALGVFEAGFFPGVILYFTYWFPSARRGKIMAIFMTSTIAASLVSGPMSGSILRYLHNVGGLAGWQWLFLLQGAPAALLGLAVFFYLDDKPDQAHWLGPEEKAIIRADLQADGGQSPHHHVGQLLRDPMLYALALVNFLMIGATYALVFWVPSLIKSWGIQNLTLLGVYAAIPNLAGIIGMVLVSRHSDHHRERRWHYAFAASLAIIGLALTIIADGDLAGSLVALSLALVGIASTTPLFMAVATEYFTREATAAGIGMVTSVGILGGGASAAVTGLISQHTGKPVYVLWIVIALFFASALVMLGATAQRK